MNSKQVVLTGLVISAFITAVVASDIVPGLFVSFIVLAGGILATFFIALSKKRQERLAEMNLMLKASQEINSQSDEDAILEKLLYWIKRLIKCEAVLLYVDGAVYPDEEYTGQMDWKELFQWVKERQEALLFKRSDKLNPAVSLPERIVSLLAVPLRRGVEIPALAVLINEQDKGFFNEQDREFIQVLSRQASIAWSKACSHSDMESFHLFMLKSLVRFWERQDPVFIGHAERVAAVSEILGRKLRLDEEEMKVLRYAAFLHDIGRFVILAREEAESSLISGEETQVNVDEHPIRGAECLPQEGIFQQIREGILYHHERYDGSGFPEGLAHTAIPLHARIIAVADIYDAMTRLCPEEERLNHEVAIKEIKKAMGSLLDPLVVVVLEEIEAEIKEIVK